VVDELGGEEEEEEKKGTKQELIGVTKSFKNDNSIFFTTSY
jgi:hypothetical protein